jgi:hypothetical protein
VERAALTHLHPSGGAGSRNDAPRAVCGRDSERYRQLHTMISSDDELVPTIGHRRLPRRNQAFSRDVLALVLG